MAKRKTMEERRREREADPNNLLTRVTRQAAASAAFEARVAKNERRLKREEKALSAGKPGSMSPARVSPLDEADAKAAENSRARGRRTSAPPATPKTAALPDRTTVKKRKKS